MRLEAASGLGAAGRRANLAALPLHAIEERQHLRQHWRLTLVLDTGAVRLNYLDQGPAAAEPLVMLHGGAWRWQEYLSLIPPLSRRWHIFALDLRGNGRSTWAPGTYRLEDFADDTSAFVEQLNAPAVLVGHSIGGVIALMVAARWPARVRALVIEDVPLTVDHYRGVNVRSCGKGTSYPLVTTSHANRVGAAPARSCPSAG